MSQYLATWQTIKQQLLTQLLNLTLNPKPDYSLDGQAVSWVQYQRFLLEMIERANVQIQIESDPFEILTQAAPMWPGIGGW